MKNQLDKCYTTFMQFQSSMKARALIASNQRDPTSNDLNPVSPELATCMCLGQCPYTSTEDTILDGGLCKYNPDEQMNNMEDLTTVGFKSIFTGDVNGKPRHGARLLEWVNSQQGFDKYAIEKMDEAFPFVNSKKRHDAVAKNMYDPKNVFHAVSETMAIPRTLPCRMYFNGSVEGTANDEEMK